MKGKILALLAGLAVALILGEVLVRFFDLAPARIRVEKWRTRLSENPEMVYEPIPNMSAPDYDMQYYLYPDQSNNLGFRGNPPLSRGDVDLRIIVLGDSVVAGIWVNNPEHLMTRIMQERLKGLSPCPEVLNFGVPGYNTTQEIAILKDRGISLDPDIVILGYCLNDEVVDNGGIVHHLKKEAQLLGWSPRGWLEESSALLSSLSSLIYAITPDVQTLVSSRSTRSLRKSETWQQNSSLNSALKNFKDLSEKHAFVPIVVIFPDFEDMAKEGCSGGQSSRSREKIVATATSHGLTVFDLCEDFLYAQGQYLGRPLNYDRYHLNENGQRVAADILLDKIKRQILKSKS